MGRLTEEQVASVFADIAAAMDLLRVNDQDNRMDTPMGPSTCLMAMSRYVEAILDQEPGYIWIARAAGGLMNQGFSHEDLGAYRVVAHGAIAGMYGELIMRETDPKKRKRLKRYFRDANRALADVRREEGY